uniref:SEC31 homolog B, COPII coat complex component n=1 Tax=Cyprinus carpio TaxID=7962 RepID=A0A8C1LEQ5_CYPCA
MRVKEILRAATQAWSPAPQHPTYLALGTAAQQLDASFNTSSALEIFEMDFADTSLDMKLRGTLPTSNRFHSLIWVAFDPEGSSGRLIGGSESGSVTVFSPDAILCAGEDAVIGQSHKHTGPVRALDYNRFQSNLVASGASDSEIYIWDLNSFSNPMTPGTKSQPAEDVSVVAWNSQVQHILASANPSGKAIVWDLRKNEPIIKISDHSNRMHCSGMLWHPEVATQLLLASEDDRLPVIQMWDLRFATSPLKVLESHTRGVLSISWSQFGGKLVTFENPTAAAQQQPIARQVQVSQVTTETEFLQRSAELQAALQSGSFTSFCHDKIRSAPSDAEQDIWRFLTVNFEDEARVKFLRLLGFSKDELQRKVSHLNTLRCESLHACFTVSDVESSNQRAEESGRESPADFFSQLPKKEKDRAPFQIPVSSDTDGLISQALLVGNFEGAVDLCLNDGRYAEAILLSISGGEELLKKTQQHYLQRQTNSVSMLISSVVTQNWRDIVQSCELDNWKEALAALLTYANPEEFAPLCDTLGSRLQAGGTEKRCLQACLCFICSGNIERLVECWTSQRDCSSPLALEPFAQSGPLGAPMGFMSGPSMPCSPPGPMMPAPPPPGFISPTSLPGGPVPLFPAAPHAQAPAPPPAGAYPPLGAGYPQGGPGAPGAKSFSAGILPPPTGTCRHQEEPLNTANYTPPAPITAPVMGFPAEAPGPQDRVQVPPGAPQEPSIQVRGRDLPAEHVEQKEIPAEHMILKTTFSSLVQRCQLAAADPQTKRKLDDASKRLETLYDKLRDQALSPSILGGLHEISRCVSARNYQQGLEVHTQVVSSSNFSEISAFMPVLKVLMTLANKLAV